MKKEDGRHASPEGQTEKRRIALRMRAADYKREEIARLVGVHPSTVDEWSCSARQHGEAAAIAGVNAVRNTESNAS